MEKLLVKLTEKMTEDLRKGIIVKAIDLISLLILNPNIEYDKNVELNKLSLNLLKVNGAKIEKAEIKDFNTLILFYIPVTAKGKQVKTNKIKFVKRIKNDEIKEVEGQKIDFVKGLNIAIQKTRYDNWDIIELSTGKLIRGFRLKKECIEFLKNLKNDEIKNIAKNVNLFLKDNKLLNKELLTEELEEVKQIEETKGIEEGKKVESTVLEVTRKEINQNNIYVCSRGVCHVNVTNKEKINIQELKDLIKDIRKIAKEDNVKITFKSIKKKVIDELKEEYEEEYRNFTELYNELKTLWVNLTNKKLYISNFQEDQEYKRAGDIYMKIQRLNTRSNPINKMINIQNRLIELKEELLNANYLGHRIEKVII